MIKKVALLGATGSIGRSTLEVLRKHRDRFSLFAFSFHSNRELARKIIEEFHPELAVVTSDVEFSSEIPVLRGVQGLKEVASRADIVLVATAGVVGVFPTVEALKNGKRVALANKETLVSFGPVVKKTLKESDGEIIPVDSEHSAIFQLLEERRDEVENIYLTASGGPFRNMPKERLKYVSPEDALKHPTWNMGKKITIDSATLINKGLEVIEAHFLFDLPPERIKVVIHPQSIIHGMVELKDGAFTAHLSIPDMKIPIQYALTYPERMESPVQPFDPFKFSTLTFERPDLDKFPGLELAYQVLKAGGEYPALYNASNEEAAYLFLDGKITFTDIPELIKRVLEENPGFGSDSLEELIEADRWARERVKEIVETL